jgi:hypothetical protein
MNSDKFGLMNTTSYLNGSIMIEIVSDNARSPARSMTMESYHRKRSRLLSGQHQQQGERSLLRSRSFDRNPVLPPRNSSTRSSNVNEPICPLYETIPARPRHYKKKAHRDHFQVSAMKLPEVGTPSLPSSNLIFVKDRTALVAASPKKVCRWNESSNENLLLDGDAIQSSSSSLISLHNVAARNAHAMMSSSSSSRFSHPITKFNTDSSPIPLRRPIRQDSFSSTSSSDDNEDYGSTTSPISSASTLMIQQQQQHHHHHAPGKPSMKKAKKVVMIKKCKSTMADTAALIGQALEELGFA